MVCPIPTYPITVSSLTSGYGRVAVIWYAPAAGVRGPAERLKNLITIVSAAVTIAYAIPNTSANGGGVILGCIDVLKPGTVNVWSDVLVAPTDVGAMAAAKQYMGLTVLLTVAAHICTDGSFQLLFAGRSGSTW